MKTYGQVCLFLFVATMASARNMERSTAEIQSVQVVPQDGNVAVQVNLTGAVSPSVAVASNPARLVLEFPNTIAGAKQQHIPVNRGGVRALRIGLTSVAPLRTRVVVDLDRMRQYGLSVAGSTVTLTVLGLQAASEAEEPEAPALFAAGGGLRELAMPAMVAAAVPNRDAQQGFRIKYVAEGAVYLAGGRNARLEPGMKLTVREAKGPRLMSGDGSAAVAVLQIVSVAEASAVTDVHGATRALRPGDWAYLSVEDTEALATRRTASGARKAPASAVSTGFVAPNRTAEIRSEADPEPGRMRGRIGFDYSGISSRGSTTGSSSQLGVVVRTDITNIAGTHWNLNGYWRGRMTTKTRADEEALRNVLNKTYTMQLTYDNPDSKWVVGLGRLYLPWANSLDTIDGGYVGRRIRTGITAGVFAGSTPDPTSWHYNPERRIAGSFVNFEGGDSDSIQYTSTAGVALNTIKWNLDRPFLFFENGIFYKKSVSVYHSFIVDAPQGTTTDGITPGPGINRSYLTVHYQPHERVSFDFYHNYFRDVPTAATALIGTGLVDKLLYQGISFGVRVKPLKHLSVYTTLGQSDKTGDVRRTLNQMYGVTLEELGQTGIRADFRYSKFDSSFGRGDYKLLTLSRHIGDRMMWDTQFGMQDLVSSFTVNNRSRFIDTSVDTNLTDQIYLQNGYTLVRGSTLNYSQWYLSLGYRFDTRPARH